MIPGEERVVAPVGDPGGGLTYRSETDAEVTRRLTTRSRISGSPRPCILRLGMGIEIQRRDADSGINLLWGLHHAGSRENSVSAIL